MNRTFTLFAFLFFSCSIISAQNLAGSGKCLNFDGTNNYINLGTGLRNITNKVTLEAWIKTTSTNNQWIIGKYYNLDDKGFQLYTIGGKAAISGRDNANIYRTADGTTLINDGKWHHLAGICNVSIWEIWVDGKLEGSLNTGNLNADLTSVQPLTIGNYAFYSDLYFNGEIDEVRIWNTARNSSDIRQYMCQKLNPNSPGLVGYYKLDEGTGTFATDKSISNITGTLINFNSNDWRTSGAPIGDVSNYIYTNSWGKLRVKLPGLSLDTFSVSNVTGNPIGVQVYRVNGSPNSINGLPSTTNINSYFGVFAAGIKSTTYTAQYKPQGITCLSDSFIFYKRPDNSGITWQKLPAYKNSSNHYFEKPTEIYRSEYFPSLKTDRVKVEIQIISNSDSCAGTPVVLMASAATAYLWNTGQTTQSISTTIPGTYTVIATDPLGCTTSDTILFNPKSPCNNGQSDLIIYNILTPNSDTKNDFFLIKNIHQYPGNELQLFNRWGQEIYKTTNYKNDWSGKDIPSGIYFYLLKLSDGRKYKGWFEIVR